MTSTTASDVDIARQVLQSGNKALVGLKDAKPFDDVLWTLDLDEERQLDQFYKLIIDYLKCPSPIRPLCLGVFGPPGSGKSFSVKRVRERVGKEPGAPKLLGVTFNLTQETSEQAVAERLTQLAKGALSDIPFVFFDEFDTAKDGSPLGWLSWFLAPMQDGEWLHDGHSQKLTKAIFVFAGGTAHCFEDFGVDDPKQFQKAKGPDFTSRLRGYLNVRGPNDTPHIAIRRALTMRFELDQCAKALGRAPNGGLKISDGLRDAMLGVGRFRHGNRSIGAILEMAAWNCGNATDLEPKHLPDEHVIAIHRDRGPLDPERIGGGIQMSCGAPAAEQSGYEAFWTTLANALWSQGATLAYGGRRPDLAARKTGPPQSLTELLLSEANALPPPLCRELPTKFEVGEHPELFRLRCFPPRELNGSQRPAERFSREIQIEDVPGLTSDDWSELGRITDSLSDPGCRDALANAICLFRMRLTIAEQTVATVAIGGKVKSSSGRYPGLAEEIMLSLATSKPVYLCGAHAGGLVQELGGILGLDRSIPSPPRPLLWSENKGWKTLSMIRDQWSRFFRSPPHLCLPVTDDDLVQFLSEHALGGPRWPSNGLTPEQNRELFQESNPQKAADLVSAGLRRHFVSK